MKRVVLLFLTVASVAFAWSCGQSKGPNYANINRDVTARQPVKPAKGMKGRIIKLDFSDVLPRGIFFSPPDSAGYFFTADCIQLTPGLGFSLKRAQRYDTKGYFIALSQPLQMGAVLRVTIKKAKYVARDNSVEDMPIIPIVRNFQAPLPRIINVGALWSQNGVTIELSLNCRPSPVDVHALKLDGPSGSAPIRRASFHEFDINLKSTTTQEGRYALTLPPEFKCTFGQGKQARTMGLASPLRIGFDLQKGIQVSQAGFLDTKSGRIVRFEFHDPYGHPVVLSTRDLQRYTDIKPEMPFTVSHKHGETAYGFKAAFKRGHAYTFTFNPPLSDGRGNRIEKPVVVLVKVPQPLPRLSIPVPGVFVARAGNTRILVNASHVHHVFATVYWMPINNLAQFFKQACEMNEPCCGEAGGYQCDEDRVEDFGEKIVSDAPVALGAGAKKTGHLFVNIQKWLKGRSKGMYYLTLRNYRMSDSWDDTDKFLSQDYPELSSAQVDTDNMKTSASTFVVVTDIALAAKVFANTAAVWAVSHNTLKPVSNVNIQVYSGKGIFRGRCRTNARGFCQAKLNSESDEPGYIFAQKGRDLAFVNLNSMALPTPSRYTYGLGGDEMPKNLVGYLFMERNIYRPGETVHLGAIVRKQGDYTGTAVPVRLKVVNPEGNRVFDMKGMTDNAGLTTFSLPFGYGASTGRYHAYLLIGDLEACETGFFIEPFTPERIHVSLTAKPAVFGSPVQAQIDAQYLFGEPAKGAPYHVLAVFRERPFMPPDFLRDYDFSLPLGPEQEAETEQFEVADKIGPQGRADFKLDQADWKRFHDTVRLEMFADVSEAMSGRKSRAYKRLTIFKYPYYIGLKQSGGTASDSVSVDGVVVDTNGALHKGDLGLTLNIQGVANRWTPSLDEDGYRWIKVTDRSTLVSGRVIRVHNGRFKVRFRKPLHAWFDFYLVTVKDDATGQQRRLKVYDWFYFASTSGDFQAPPPERLALKTDKTAYDWGDPVTVYTSMPFAGRVLWIVETDELKTYKWTDAQKGRAVFRFKAPANTSTAFVSALLVRRDKNSMLPRAFGMARVALRPARHKLKFTLNTPASARPLTDFHVVLHADRPFEAVISVVDEGILQLTNFKTPDLFKGVFRAFALASRAFETFGLFRGIGLLTGGGEGEAPEQSQPRKLNFQHLVSHFSGVVKSDAKGNLDYTFRVPRFYGKLRVMVHTADPVRMASRDSDVVVRDKFVIQPTIPRFAFYEDEFTMPVFYTNTQATALRLTGRVDVKNGRVVSGQVVDKTVKPHDNGVLFVRVRTGKYVADMGITLKFQWPGGGFNDTFDIPVHPNRPRLKIYKTFRAGASEYPVKDYIKTLLPRELKVRVSAGPLPLGRSLQWLGHLVHYPYGCVEQTGSQLLPLIELPALAGFVDQDLLKQERLFGMVNTGISRILSMQLSNGGFAYWPGGYEAAPWSSAYATMVLHLAKQAGYFVPDAVMDAAVSYVENLDDSPFNMFVLGMLGQLKAYRLKQYLKAGAQQYMQTREAVLFLAGAAHFAGMERTARSLFARARKLRPVRIRNFFMDFMSPWRERLVRAYVDTLLNPGNAARDSVRIMKTLGPDATTQEAGWATLVLGNYLKKFKSSGPMNVSLQVNGQAVAGTQTKAGVTFDVKYPDSSSIVVGQGAKPYITVQASGFQESGLFKPDTHGVHVEKHILDLSGRPLKVFPVGKPVVVEVEVMSRLSRDVQNMVIHDRLPMGLELPSTDDRDVITKLNWIDPRNEVHCDHVQRGDQDIACFFTLPARANLTFHYLANVVTAEHGFMPQARASCMYDPDVHGASRAGIIVLGTGKVK